MTQITADRLPRSNRIKEGAIRGIPTAGDISITASVTHMGNTLHSKLFAVPALLAFTLTGGDKDTAIGLLFQALLLLTATAYEQLNTVVIT